MAAIERVVPAPALGASKRIKFTRVEVDKDRDRALRAAGHLITLATSQLGDAMGQIARSADAVRRNATTRIKFFVEQIVALGPEATLRPGDTTVREVDGRPLGTRTEAESRPILEIEFQDGRLRVENQVARGPER
jgi:exonuclease VII large subunit